MEEFRHPPVEIDVTLAVNQERAFAQRAFAALETYSGIGQDEILGQPVRFPITDRIDMAIPEDATTEVAMRLIGTPIYRLGKSEVTSSETVYCQESSEYIVIELQYGELPEDEIEDIPEDEDYDWQPYIVVVIDARHPYSPSVLNAETGEPLSAPHLMQASVILDQVCAQLEALTLDSAASIAIGDETDTLVKDKYGYLQFDPDDFIESSPCEACIYEGVPCLHQPGALN